MTRRRNNRTPGEVADFIENFLDGRGGAWDWDEFITLPIRDHDLDRIRIRCAELPEIYPPGEGEAYCAAEGEAELRHIVNTLRSLSAMKR